MPDSDVKLLETAKERARKAVEKEPSRANLDAYDKASRMLAECMAGEAEASFGNRLEAHQYLRRLGYKIGKSKFYQDCKAGLCRMQADASIYKSDLDGYITKADLIKPDQVKKDIESSDLNLKKQRKIVEKLTIELEEMELKLKMLKKKYDDEVETAQAIKAGALMAAFNFLYRSISRDIIQLVEGNYRYTQPLIAFLIEKAEDLFDGFAKMEEIEIEVKN